jgi:hypothetical protein
MKEEEMKELAIGTEVTMQQTLVSWVLQKKATELISSTVNLISSS